MNAENDHKPHRGRKFRGKRLRTSLPKPEAEAPIPERKDSDRIAKVIARAGLTSRREAETWIEAGRVAVNGEVIRSPALNVGPNDRIAVDGKPLPTRERTRLFLFHKPRGLVTTNADPEGRPTIFGALPTNLPRLVTVGRLDMNTEGLLLLTNDGGLARALELPATGWLRRYRVRAYGEVLQPRLDSLRKGIEVDGVRYGAIEATLDRQQGDNSWITFAMREGKNREIRNVLGALGLKVNRLIRLSYGPFQLAELPAGAVEEVKTRALREQLGERLVAIAGADFSGPIVEREIVEEEPQAQKPARHPEVRGAQRRASKDDAPDRPAREPSKGTLRLPRDKDRGRSSFEGRPQARLRASSTHYGRPSQDDGERKQSSDKRHLNRSPHGDERKQPDGKDGQHRRDGKPARDPHRGSRRRSPDRGRRR
ncbi:pseudouridine synthase [Rhodoplanes sp. Z2-YC6860]|uniref:pseudouridine synthase n=1 Tax=Rhodoplanes sp. Z2-YC6860 TaxID=674703 RepID=UPI001F02C40E|nr:pseudouridine synthase [Rhodoplanes sp. Z2-YC6860]